MYYLNETLFCIECRKCEEKCPYDLEIIDLLKESHECHEKLCEQLGKL